MNTLILSCLRFFSACISKCGLHSTHFMTLACFISIPGIMVSQNLVVNGDFEAYSSCPTDASQLYLASPWLNPSTDTVTITPDYFNACLSMPCKTGVPSNKHGNSLYAHSGNGYAGIITYYRQPPAVDTSSREYISVPLSSALIAGSVYKVKFYVRKPSTSGYATQIGAHLSVGPLVQNGIYAYNITPNVTETSVLTDTTWTLVNVSYTASGNETHLTIGNFRNDAGTALLSNVGLPNSCLFTTTEWLAYYLIDDVSVSGDSPSSAGNNLPAVNDIIKLYPNPFSDQLNVTLGTNEAVTLILYDISSRQLLRQTFTTSATVSTESLTSGIYFYELRNDKGTLRTGKVVKQ